MSILERSQLCRAFEPEEVMAFEALAHRRPAPDGETILELDEPNRSLFVVESGAVLIERDVGQGSIPVAELGPGETFGEMSFIDHGPASARVRAHGDTVLVELSHEMLEELLEDHPALWGRVWRNVARILKQRLVHANELFERHVDSSTLDPNDPELRTGRNRG